MLYTSFLDEFWLEILSADDPVDFALGEHAYEIGAFACFGRSCPCAAIVDAVRIRQRVSTAVVGDTEIDLSRRDLAEPKEIESVIDLFEISVRLD